MASYYSTGEVATILHQPRWHILRLFEDGDIPEPGRLAGKRVISGDQLPAIVDALKARGWIEPKEPASAN
jgi:DNA-binding MarR family transcriptional regulator